MDMETLEHLRGRIKVISPLAYREQNLKVMAGQVHHLSPATALVPLLMEDGFEHDTGPVRAVRAGIKQPHGRTL